MSDTPEVNAGCPVSLAVAHQGLFLGSGLTQSGLAFSASFQVCIVRTLQCMSEGKIEFRVCSFTHAPKQKFGLSSDRRLSSINVNWKPTADSQIRIHFGKTRVFCTFDFFFSLLFSVGVHEHTLEFVFDDVNT